MTKPDSRRPRVGVLLDYVSSGGFSNRPHYALRRAYFDAVWQAGGLPFALPYLPEAGGAYLETMDALVFPGGFYPFPKSVYGEAAPADEAIHPRHAFEVDFMRAAHERDMPTLGICAGMQVMAVLDGATLYPDLKSDPGSPVDHLNGKPAEQTAHGVRLKAGSQLRRIIGRDEIQVNTAHNEAVRKRPGRLLCNAVSEDGLVEGVEDAGRAFWIGVQWHPEFFPTTGEADFKLFKALIKAARG